MLLNTTRVALKIFPPKNLYIYIYIHTHTHTLSTISYQMSLVLFAGHRNPVDSNYWTLGCLAVLSIRSRNSCWENNFNFGTFWWIIRTRSLNRKFLNPSPCRRSVSNCWTLGCWSVVLSTRPRSSYWENNFETYWWIMRSKNLIRKSRSPYGCRNNYTKFFGGNFELVTRILGAQFTTKLTCVTKNFAAVNKAWQCSALATRSSWTVRPRIYLPDKFL